MDGNKEILLLRLEGVLQSWGENSKWDWRDSATMPTKSGIIGLIGCAMGYERNDPRLSELSNAFSMIAIRADRAGQLMTDFHTVQAERLLNAAGKQRGGGNTIISHRSYLQDACFTVAISGEGNVVKNVYESLIKPKWSIFLGRKSCVPSCPVVLDITNKFSSVKEALMKYPLSERADKNVMIEIGCDNEDNSEYQRMDERGTGEREFRQRRVIRFRIPEKEEHVSQ